MTTAANALKAYLEAEKTEYVDVPELGDGEPLRLFYTPFSGLDMATIQRKHDDFPSTKIEAMFDVIIQEGIGRERRKGVYSTTQAYAA